MYLKGGKVSSYEEWNNAIATYFTVGVPSGSSIFLGLDHDAIEDIAYKFLHNPPDDPIEDFKGSVREYCIPSFSSRVNLYVFRKQINQIPGGIGFLGLMVYAAYKMHDEEGIDETNYFLRLREALGLLPIPGRPEGMPPGEEEPLWIKWNEYLNNSGFESTAERGTGPQTYLRYVISQTILRESDKEFLNRRFKEVTIPLRMDCDQLGFWLTTQHINRRHLSEGLHHPDPSRVWEFYQAAHRLYETQDWMSDQISDTLRKCSRSRNIECGLYRIENLFGGVSYYVFPKQPGRQRSSQLTVGGGNEKGQVQLNTMRPGFFKPLWPENPFVNEPIEIEVRGDPLIRSMFFPKRDFWILTTDPENPQGAWATWKPYYELGEKLLILCRKGVFDKEMERLRDSNLLQWSERNEEKLWIEYYNCMILSYDWGGYIASTLCKSLIEALAPRSIAGVSLSGGLRVPIQNAWIEGYPPSFKIYGFEKNFNVSIISAHDTRLFDEEVPSQEVKEMPPTLLPDTYQIFVKWSGKKVATRMFRIISWDDIKSNPEPENIVNSHPASTGGLIMQGPIIAGNQEIPGEMRNG